jgi:TolA-binding protein
MTRFDLHPEDLLERAQRGSASAADLARLDQHLAECAVCRVERALGSQAALDVEPLRDEKLLVARLKRDVAERLNNPSQGRGRRKGAVIALSLVAASLASVAAAATVAIVKRDAAPSSVPVEAAPAPAKASESLKPAPVPKAEPAPSPEPAPATPPDAAPKPAPVETGSASELFSRANQARRDGKAKEAVRLYRALQERHAGSGEELVSRVALGRLLLDRLGDSRGALVQFNSYLASPGNGALREEAMVGRALSLGRIGRSNEERAAWRALLEAWPKSTHAKRAQARLAELAADDAGGPARSDARQR